MLDSRPGRSAAPLLEAGSPQPLGASWTGRGINFAVFSHHATRVELCLFDAAGAQRNRAARRCPSRTGDIWHGFLPARFGGPGSLYGYRVHGPYRARATGIASIRRSCWSIPARSAARRTRLAPVA